MFSGLLVYCGCKMNQMRLITYQGSLFSGCLMQLVSITKVTSHNNCLLTLAATRVTTQWLKQPICFCNSTDSVTPRALSCSFLPWPVMFWKPWSELLATCCLQHFVRTHLLCTLFWHFKLRYTEIDIVPHCLLFQVFYGWTAEYNRHILKSPKTKVSRRQSLPVSVEQ